MNQRPSQHRALRFYVERQQPSCPGTLYWLVLVLLILLFVIGVIA